MPDDIGDFALGVIPTPNGDISGPAEWGLVAVGVILAAGFYRFLSKSSLKADGPIPPISFGNVNLGPKSK